MSFALVNPANISTEEVFERVKNLTKNQRSVFDLERYRVDSLGHPLGSKKAIMWLDIMQELKHSHDSNNESHLIVLDRVDKKFRDETTRKLATDIIRQKHESKT